MPLKPPRHLRRLAQRPLPQTAKGKPGFCYPTDRQLVQEVQRYLEPLEKICNPEQILQSPRGFEGIFLEKVLLELKSRHGKNSDFYHNTTLEYDGYLEKTRAFVATRHIFCRGLALHPVTRALSLLAVGKTGVKMMEKGMAPSGLFARSFDVDYNRHHIVQKSARALDGRPINHFSNLVLIMTGATGEWRTQPKNPSYQSALDPRHPDYNPAEAQLPHLNAHHFFHGAILASQTERNTGAPKISTVYCPRPAFPIYPPISTSIGLLRSPEEVRERLDEIEPGLIAQLPADFKFWAQKLVHFSRACDHQPYVVPPIGLEATFHYTQIYQHEPLEESKRRTMSASELKAYDQALEHEQDRRRENLARAQEQLACRYLPLEAKVNGRKVSSILDEATKQHQPIPHQPIPLVPEDWKPLKNYQGQFPSLQRIHRNMREVGLGDRIPSPDD